MTPKPKPPALSPESLARFRSILERGSQIREKALNSRFRHHPTAREIVASCDAGIADILRTYPEVGAC